MVFDHVADGQHQAGEGGQGLAFQHAGEHILELGNDIDHEDAQDAGGDNEHGDGVEHGGLDLALDLLGLFHELGEAVQHHLQHAAQLAGLDHVDEEPVEDLGMLGQALGEGAAAFNRHGQLADDRLEGRIPFLLFEHAQAAQQGQPGIHQRRQLAGESGEDLGFYPPAQPGDFDVEVDVESLALSSWPPLWAPGRPSSRPSPWPSRSQRSWSGTSPFP